MVTYLSGERIQGSSTTSPVTTGYLSIDNESASSSSGSLATSIDLLGSNINDSSWVLRFKYTVTSGADGIGSAVAFGLTDNDYQTHALGTQKCIGFKIANSEGGATAGTVSMFPAPDELDPETHINFSSLPFTRYFELRRISASGSAQYTLKAYTASDYTGTPATADRDPASITGLRYFKVANYTGSSNTGGAVGRVTDLKFWNNEQDTTEDPDVDILQSSGTITTGTWGSMVSPPTSPANGLVSTLTNEKTTVSNIPVGTRFEEIDTRKIFRRKIGVEFTQSSSNASEEIDPAGNYRAQIGQRFKAGQIIVGGRVTKATFYIADEAGSAAGTVNAYIREGDGTLKETSTDTYNASTFSSSYVAKTFDFPSTTIDANDMIMVSFANGTGTNKLKVSTNSGEIANGELWEQYNTAYAKKDTNSAKMIIEYDSWTEKGTA